MKIYLDLVFFLNLFFNFLLLLTVSVMLKRNTKIKRIILGAFIGSLSIFILFIDIGNIGLFIFKILISFIMIIITFGIKNTRYLATNLLYLYFSSIVLGGFLYFLNLEFSNNFDGLIFYHNGFSINIVVLIIISPIILYFYLKQNKIIHKQMSHIYSVEMYYQNKVYKYRGFLDTGNQLYDQYKKRPINLLYDSSFKVKYEDAILVPFKTLNNSSLLRCIKVDKIILDEKQIFNNVLIGLSNEKFSIDEVDMILHNDLLKGEKR